MRKLKALFGRCDCRWIRDLTSPRGMHAPGCPREALHGPLLTPDEWLLVRLVGGIMLVTLLLWGVTA